MKKTLGLVLLVLLTASCATNVKTKKYTSADFNNFKTFAYFAETSSFNLSEFNTDANNPVEQSVITLINAKMIEKGFSVNTKNPDVLILLVTSNEIKSNLNNEKTEIKGGSGQGPNFASATSSVTYKRYDSKGGNIEASNRPFKKGDLAIEVYDTKSKDLLWRGLAQDFKAHISDQTLMARMISGVFDKFPDKN